MDEAAFWPLTDEQLEDLGRRLDARKHRSEPADGSCGDTPKRRDAGLQAAATAAVAPVIAARPDAPVVAGAATSLPSYLAAVLTDAEAAFTQRDVAARIDNEALAKYWGIRVIELVRLGVDRATDEFDIEAAGVAVDEEELLSSRDLLLGSRAPNAGHVDLATFQKQEETLLHLVGLSHALAAQHYAAALEHYRRRPDIQRLDDLSRTLDKAREELRRAQVDLAAEPTRPDADVPRGRRKRRKLRLALTVLGGVTIAVANTAGAPLLGPLAAPSLLLGGGAAGAVVNLIND